MIDDFTEQQAAEPFAELAIGPDGSEWRVVQRDRRFERKVSARAEQREFVHVPEKADVKNRVEIVQTRAMVGVERFVAAVVRQSVEAFVTQRMRGDFESKIGRRNGELMWDEGQCLDIRICMEYSHRHSTHGLHGYHVHFECLTAEQPVEQEYLQIAQLIQDGYESTDRR